MWGLTGSVYFGLKAYEMSLPHTNDFNSAEAYETALENCADFANDSEAGFLNTLARVERSEGLDASLNIEHSLREDTMNYLLEVLFTKMVEPDEA